MTYAIEIHNPAGDLLAILKDTYKATLEETVNAPKHLSFQALANDPKLSYISRENELWVRDVENDVVLAKVRLLRDDAKR
jgi:hypothetical protein